MKKFSGLLAVTLLVSVFVGLVVLYYAKFMTQTDSAFVSLPSAPWTADTFEYDVFAHHASFKSVLGNLVSEYKVGDYQPMLASSWSTSHDQKVWVFHLRPEARYETGARITARDMVRSWIRLAFHLTRTHSHSDLFDSIIGMEHITHLDQSIVGLIADGSDLKITLKHPYPKLLETVAFGIYAVVYSGDYDPTSGAWLNPRHITSANAYRVAEWTDTNLILALRPDAIPGTTHPHPLKKYVLTWETDKRNSADIILGDSNDRGLLAHGYTFYGGTPANIAYAHCFSWRKLGSICGDLESRKKLRALLYEAMEAGGVKPIRSFFPLGMNGIRELAADAAQSLENKKIRFLSRRKIGNEIYTSIRHFLPIVSRAHNSLAEEVDLPLQEIRPLRNTDLDHYPVDIGLMGTGVLIEAPRSDIRFMFLTKEGVRLPDTDGRIIAEIDKPDFSPQVINQLLWDQAAIIPLGHFSYGIWTKNNFDLSMLNSIQPPIEFNWIGLKK